MNCEAFAIHFSTFGKTGIIVVLNYEMPQALTLEIVSNVSEEIRFTERLRKRFTRFLKVD